MAVGIRLLAQQLDLSISTVSRALNGSGPVNEKTGSAFFAAAAMGYVPNVSGGSLRRGRVDTVGLLLPVYSHVESHAISLFIALASGLRHALAHHKINLAIFQNDSEAEELVQIRILVARRQVDGFILSNTRRRDKRIDFLVRQDFPFAAFGRSDSGKDHAWVDFDFDYAAKAGFERLHQRRHRRIGLVLPRREMMLGRVYLKSHKAALKCAGIPFDPRLVEYDELSEYGATDVLMQRSSPPSAVIFLSDSMAIGAYRKLAEISMRPGTDIAVSTGFFSCQASDDRSPRRHPSGRGSSLPVQETCLLRLVPQASDDEGAVLPAFAARS